MSLYLKYKLKDTRVLLGYRVQLNTIWYLTMFWFASVLFKDLLHKICKELIICIIYKTFSTIYPPKRHIFRLNFLHSLRRFAFNSDLHRFHRRNGNTFFSLIRSYLLSLDGCWKQYLKRFILTNVHKNSILFDNLPNTSYLNVLLLDNESIIQARHIIL